MSLRHWLRKQMIHSLLQEAKAISAAELRRSAVIFAPHPDDESLACGGTIARKVQLGARVQVVYMTDGRHSHSRYIRPHQLAALRTQEALAAGRMLGLNDVDATFLNFEDGCLAQEETAAIRSVTGILNSWQPEEVYIPYRHEPPADHVATHHIVLAALRESGLKPVIYEYSVWFWQHWPWTPFPGGSRQANWNYIKNSLTHGLGLQLMRDFRRFVPVAEVLEQKKVALAQHKTQMARQSADAPWPILADVDKGEFLSLFFQPYEIFLERYN